MVRVTREQSMQKRGSAAWQTNDEQRFWNRLPRNLRKRFAIPLHEQPVAQGAKQVRSERESPDQVQLRFTQAGFNQSRERFPKIIFTKVVALRVPFRCCD